MENSDSKASQFIHPEYCPDNETFQTKKLKFISHPDDFFYDEVKFEIQERFKTSVASGDEWRFNHKAKVFKRGVLLHEFAGRDFPKLANDLAFGLQSVNNFCILCEMPIEWDLEERHEKLLKTKELEKYCCHPGCKNEASRIYVLKHCYTKCCQEKSDNRKIFWHHVLDARKFCDYHGVRGDCALDDSDQNYIGIKGHLPGKWTELIEEEKISRSGLIILGGVMANPKET